MRFLTYAIELQPNYAEAFVNLANVLCNQKSRDNDHRAEGVTRYSEAIRFRTDLYRSHLQLYNLGSVLSELQL